MAGGAPKLVEWWAGTPALLQMAPMGKLLVAIGLVLVVAGLAIWGLGSIGWIGRLPGDIYLRRGNATFYFPLATCILLSIVISLILMLLRR